jgi:hypothetical protein
VACDTPRWSLATTFPACRDYLPRESPTGDGQATVRRCSPCCWGCYPTIVRRSLQLSTTASTLGAVFGTGNSTVTCSAMMTCVRRARWQPWCVHTPDDPQEYSNLSRALQETFLEALAPVASWRRQRRRRRSALTPMPHKRTTVELRIRSGRAHHGPPKKKPRGRELTPPEKAINRRISSIRIRLEHASGGVTRDRMVKDNIRLLKHGIRDTIMKTCCGMQNFRLQYRPWHHAS